MKQIVPQQQCNGMRRGTPAPPPLVPCAFVNFVEA